MSSNETLLFEPKLILNALRDAGYKDTPHGLAELIDNSIQAGATQVHVYMFSEMVQLNMRQSEQVVKIAVLDNGHGMDATTLEKSIGFGSGERLNATKGLGKFGMGLSAASIAFAQEMRIFSWQNGVDTALMTSLSTERITNGEMHCPEPALSAIDQDVEQIAASNIGRRGTLVVWEQLNLSTKRFSSLSSNLEFLIGRIYRKFLHAGAVGIEVHDVLAGRERSTLAISPNDPLFLMAPSNTPAPYDNDPLFKEFGAMVQPKRKIKFRSQRDPRKGVEIEGEVRVKLSHIRPGIRSQYRVDYRVDAGNSDFGKFARRNVGYSICREGRELILDGNFAKPSEPTERWWGVEIDFDASLDEIFQVTTNKQEALAVRHFHHWNWKDEALDGESQSEFLERCREEGDPRAELMELFRDIDNALATIRQLLTNDQVGARGSGGGSGQPVGPGPETIATEVAQERENEGQKGEAFNDELPPTEEVIDAAEEEQVAEEAQNHIVQVLERGERFAIEIGDNPDSPAFFMIRRQRGLLLVVINSSHSFYKTVYEKLFGEPSDNETDEDKLKRLETAQNAFKLALIAWARMEDESPSKGEFFRETRSDWGRILKQFLKSLVPEGN